MTIESLFLHSNNQYDKKQSTKKLGLNTIKINKQVLSTVNAPKVAVKSYDEIPGPKALGDQVGGQKRYEKF